MATLPTELEQAAYQAALLDFLKVIPSALPDRTTPALLELAASLLDSYLGGSMSAPRRAGGASAERIPLDCFHLWALLERKQTNGIGFADVFYCQRDPRHRLEVPLSGSYNGTSVPTLPSPAPGQSITEQRPGEVAAQTADELLEGLRKMRAALERG